MTETLSAEHRRPTLRARTPLDRATVRLSVLIPVYNERDTIDLIIDQVHDTPTPKEIICVDDHSTDGTQQVLEALLVRGRIHQLYRHPENRGKGAAMETGAAAVRLLDDGEPRHLLFLDADLGDTAKLAGPLIEPVRAGSAAMTIAVFSDRVKLGGHGFVVRLSRDGIKRLTGWTATQPLNGQRCLTRAAFDAAQPLAPGFGVETGLTIDLLRKGFPIQEVEVPLSHRATGTDWRSQLHRGRQFRDVARALAVREPSVARQLTRLRHAAH